MELSTQLEPTLELFVTLFIGLAAFSAFMLITTIRQMRTARKRHHWSITQGTITTSELETHKQGGNEV
jgi:hypothetical protein